MDHCTSLQIFKTTDVKLVNTSLVLLYFVLTLKGGLYHQIIDPLSLKQNIDLYHRELHYIILFLHFNFISLKILPHSE